ncbi:MAG: hypothetical protein H6R12_2556 [Proteobacteria bacterium]|nr:hypothetical protein [Pseudomonadota bacterium]
MGGLTRPTTGVTRKPVLVLYSGSVPSTSTWLRRRPISSSASRRAVMMGEASSSSLRPPGNDTWPG